MIDLTDPLVWIVIASAVGGALIWRGKITSNIKMLNAAMEKIPDDMKNGMNNMKSDMNNMNNGIEKLRNEIRDDLKEIRKEIRDDKKEIQADIKRIFERLPPTPQSIASGSPLHLTALGQSISDELDVSEWGGAVCA